MKSATSRTVVGAIDTDVLQFTAGLDTILDRRLVEWDCYGTAAHVTMLSRIKVKPTLFTAKERAAVVRELGGIARLARENRFDITDEDQDCHLAIERVLTEKLGDLGKRVHTGRSRNDQSATAIRLFARNELRQTALETLSLCEALVKFGKKNKILPMVGRTHLQPAMPSSVGVWATAYSEELLDTVQFVLHGAYAFNNRCPLGSAASYGVPLPIDRELTARLLAFEAPIHNVLAAGNSRGKNESVIVSALAQLMVTVSRLAQDLIIFTMPEFGYFKIPREFCTGSSIMPQKYNPDICELVRSRAAQVVALATAADGILVAMPGGYNRDLQDTKKLLMEGFDTTRATLRIMTALAGGLEADAERLRRAFEDPGVFATDRALELVAGGMPFRDAYHQVRDHLEDLCGMDPDDVIARKRHLGATAGLDFALYNRRITATRRGIATEARRVNTALSRLIG